MTSTLSPTAYLTSNQITMEKSTSSTTTGSGGGGEDNSHVTKLRENDVLLGRGGGTNNHAGNVKFRKLVNEHKLRYLAASKVDKPKVAREVVQLWRQMNPPGRFLARTDEDKKEKATEENTIWYDVGDKKANAKASQCLRERTPEVMPYLRQLREQQDLSTEQGVMMVRQQQQQQAAVAAGGAAPGMPGMGQYGDPYGPPGAYPPPMMAGQPGPYPGAAPHSMSPHHVRQALPPTMSPHGRRASAPHMQGSPVSYSPRTAGGGLMPPYNPMATASPNGASNPQRRGMPGMSPVGGGPNGTTAPGYGYPQAPHLDDGGVVDPMDPSVAAYYGDMTDLEYEQSMMIMQQQLEMQQMQLRRMQQQRAMQRAAMSGQASPPGSSHDYDPQQQQGQVSPNGMGGSNRGLSRKAGNFPQGGGPAGYGGAAPPAQGAPHNTRLPHQPPSKMTATPGSTTTARDVPPDANARKPKRTLSMTRPERTHSGLLHMNAPELPATAEQDGELTLEEYRQQLEAYISNTKNEDGNAQAHIDEGDDDHSDLEDDWEKERDKYSTNSPSNHRARGVARTRSRGVDRAKSGASFMSIATNKSAGNMSMVSGFTNLSDLMSAASAEAEKQPPKNRGVDRNQSNLSIMSELTDLSANIDNLSLYED